MPVILLDAQQTSVLASSYESIPVRDQAGTLLGHVLPTGIPNGQQFVSPNVGGSRCSEDHWIECWDEWYAEPDEEEEKL